jgi:probable phosphoglycerate mutase
VNRRATTRITLVRHGESMANSAQRWQGQGDSPLSPRGQAQARLLGARLALAEKPDASRIRVVSSDLSRAADTAHALGLPVEQRSALREFDVGRWEGLTRDEVMARYPEEMARLNAGEDVALGGGESYSRFAARVDAAFAELRAEASPDEHWFVVCHGGVIGAVLGKLCGFRQERRYPLARPSNTSLTDIVFSEDSAVLRVFNDTRHLSHTESWPDAADASALVALYCEEGATLPGAPCTHYATASDFPEHGADPSVAQCVGVLQGRHPAGRVALRAPRAAGWSFLTHTLWPSGTPEGRGIDPSRRLHGHVGRVHDRLTVLDFGAYEG